MRNLSVLGLILLTLLPNQTIAAFDGCDNAYTLNPGISYLESPYYPNYYPSNTACRYKFTAPLDYTIRLNCTINLYTSGSACDYENLYLDLEGDLQMRGAENFCGSGTFVRTSLFRQVALAYVSQGAWGKFRCEMYVSPQSCDCGWSVNTRIANGETTAINEFPSMAALKNTASTSASPFCGAVIVSHRHLLTAAHCTRLQPDPSKMIAIVGEHDLSSTTETKYTAQYAIQQIIEHEAYAADPTTVNDIAVVVTVLNIEWMRGVGPICLPPTSSASNDFLYTFVNVIGWGTKFFAGPTSSTLQKVELMITSNSYCQQQYPSAVISSAHICTYDYSGTNRDSCQYDSGGPVVWRGQRQFLLGCVSFGGSCGTGGSPTGVNTRITTYLNWIQAKIGYSACSVAMQ